MLMSNDVNILSGTSTSSRLSRTPLAAHISTAIRATAGAVVLSGAAMTPALASDSDDNFLLEEIIVTARFKEESAQDIGQSITAIGTAEIERAGIVNMADLALRTPGLDFNDKGPNRNDVSMRGISPSVGDFGRDSLGSQSLVTSFIDDISVTSSNASQRSFNLFDFNRVEVLRGPQPTYFGEGAVGGTIRYFSTDPTLEGPVSGRIATDTSSTDNGGTNYTLNGALDLTLIENELGVRLTAFTRDDDGFIDDELNGRDGVNTYESDGGRVVVKWQPNDKFSARFAHHFSRDDQGADWLVDDTSDDYVISSRPGIATTTDDFDLSTLNLTYDFGSISLTSVTGLYERDRTVSGYDFVQSLNSHVILYGIPGDVISTTNNVDENFSQEFRIISEFEGPFNFTGGLFYRDSESTSSFNAISSTIAALPGLTDGFMSGDDGNTAPPATREQLAVFFEGTFDITDNLKLIAGARWLDEDQETPVRGNDNRALAECRLDVLGNSPGAFFVPCVNYGYGTNAELLARIGKTGTTKITNTVDGEILPKVAIEYRASEDVLLYASYSKGMRNGGINSIFVLQAAEVSDDALGYDQDELDAYELGIKSTWLDGDLVFNSAVFYYDWQDIQVQLATSMGALLANAPAAQSMGVEAEFVYRVNDMLRLSGGANYTKAEYDGDLVTGTPEAAALFAFFGIPLPVIEDGFKLPNVPEYTYSLAADLVVPVSDGLSFTGRLDYQYQDDRFSAAVNDSDSMLDAYGIANLRAGLKADNWSVTAYVTNLFNEIESQSFFRAGGGGNRVEGAYINRPRTAGINLRYEF